MAERTNHIETRVDQNVLVVTILDDRLDDYLQMRSLSAEIEAALTASPTKKMALDMQHVQMITSVALLPIVGVRSMVERQGGRLLLCDLTDVVAQVLTVSQLLVESRDHAKYLSMASDVEAAIAELTGK